MPLPLPPSIASSQVNKKFPTMPFTLRSLADESAAKLGVRECVNHDLLASYPVLTERPGVCARA